MASVDGRRCERCTKPAGAGAPLRKCSRCSVAFYCGEACQTADWKPSHRYDCAAPDESEEATIDRQLAVNARATERVRANRPTVIGPRSALLQAIRANHLWFYQRQYATVPDDGDVRFLVTPGMLMCHSVFAWCPEAESGPHKGKPVAFGAHVDLATVLGAARAGGRGNSVRPIQELRLTLKRVFRHCAAGQVRIVVVGGHSDDAASKRHGFLEAVSLSCKVQGLPAADSTTYVNRFPGCGVDYAKSIATNQSYLILGIDVASGRIFSHTSARNPSPVSDEEERAASLHTMSLAGQPYGKLARVSNRRP